MMLVNLFKSSNVSIAYYGDAAIDYEIERDCLSYLQKLAIMDENGPKTQTHNNIFKTW